jgi:PilZ domain
MLPTRVNMDNGTGIPDRRLAPRHSLQIPLQLRIWRACAPACIVQSVNISGRGVLLDTELPLQVGSAVELHLKLPEEITSQPTTEWRCRGRVVRVVRRVPSNSQLQVGVCFESLDASRL